jgi:hypothetical protein
MIFRRQDDWNMYPIFTVMSTSQQRILDKSRHCTCRLRGHPQDGGRFSTAFKRKSISPAAPAGGAGGTGACGRLGQRPQGQLAVLAAWAAHGQQRAAGVSRPNKGGRMKWVVLDLVCLVGATNYSRKQPGTKQDRMCKHVPSTTASCTSMKRPCSVENLPYTVISRHMTVQEFSYTAIYHHKPP